MTTIRIRTLAASLLVGLALLFVPVVASAQTALTTTTLSAIVTNPSDQSVSVTSATGITAPGTGVTFVYLLIDKELMGVRAISGTAISVSRGQNGTRATAHATLATVTIVPPTAIFNYTQSGQCVRTNLPFVPMVIGGGDEQSFNGTTFDCLGVTTAGQWVSTNVTQTGVQGTTVASPAGVLTPTGTIFTVSGTSAITGITVPAGAGPGFTIYMIPSGVFTWTAAGNIALAGTAVVGKLLQFTWNPLTTKWVPSYIA